MRSFDGGGEPKKKVFIQGCILFIGVAKLYQNLTMMGCLDMTMEFHSSIFRPNCHIWGWEVGTPQADTLEGQGPSYGQRSLLPIDWYMTFIDPFNKFVPHCSVGAPNPNDLWQQWLPLTKFWVVTTCTNLASAKMAYCLGLKVCGTSRGSLLLTPYKVDGS